MRTAGMGRGVVAGLAMVGALALAGCDKVTFTVSGQGSATVVYQTAEKNAVTEKDVKLPWSKEVGAGSQLALRAYGATGVVDCEIKTKEGVVGGVGEGSCTARK